MLPDGKKVSVDKVEKVWQFHKLLVKEIDTVREVGKYHERWRFKAEYYSDLNPRQKCGFDLDPFTDVQSVLPVGIRRHVLWEEQVDFEVQVPF